MQKAFRKYQMCFFWEKMYEGASKGWGAEAAQLIRFSSVSIIIKIMIKPF